MCIHLQDNNYGKEFEIVGEVPNLEHIANFKLTDKDEAGSLLVFPQSFRDTEFYSSREKAEDAPVIIELVRDSEGKPTKIRTGNVMGFIGYKDTEIRIHSRFDVKDNNCEKANDFFLYHMIRSGFHPCKIFMLACNAFKDVYDEETIKHWLTTFYKRFFSQQFKRSCMPDGPKVGSISLSPRGDWRMPSDATAEAWIEECKALKTS